jgi:hypothetical protein
VSGGILFPGKDNIFAWAGGHISVSQMNQGIKLAPEVDGAKEFNDPDHRLFFGLDTDWEHAILAPESKLLKQH